MAELIFNIEWEAEADRLSTKLGRVNCDSNHKPVNGNFIGRVKNFDIEKTA